MKKNPAKKTSPEFPCEFLGIKTHEKVSEELWKYFQGNITEMAEKSWDDILEKIAQLISKGFLENLLMEPLEDMVKIPLKEYLQ